jgi:valyl-tRNA synthetase
MILVTDTPEIYEQGAHFIKRLATVSELTVTKAAPSNTDGMVTLATANATIYMPLSDLVDIAQELARMEKEKAKAQEGLSRIEAKLQNQGFLSKAPANVVEGQKQQAEKYRALIAKLEESMAQMKN